MAAGEGSITRTCLWAGRKTRLSQEGDGMCCSAKAEGTLEELTAQCVSSVAYLVLGGEKKQQGD